MQEPTAEFFAALHRRMGYIRPDDREIVGGTDRLPADDDELFEWDERDEADMERRWSQD